MARLSTWSLRPGEIFASLGYSDQVSALVKTYHETTDPSVANHVAWCCVLGLLQCPIMRLPFDSPSSQ